MFEFTARYLGWYILHRKIRIFLSHIPTRSEICHEGMGMKRRDTMIDKLPTLFRTTLMAVPTQLSAMTRRR